MGKWPESYMLPPTMSIMCFHYSKEAQNWHFKSSDFSQERESKLVEGNGITKEKAIALSIMAFFLLIPSSS